MFTTLSPQKHCDLKSDLITLLVTRLDVQKVDTIGLD